MSDIKHARMMLDIADSDRKAICEKESDPNGTEFPQMSFVPGLYRRPAYDVC